VSPVHVAFLWHQHQPYYKDPLTGRCAMPWTRLHAIKDYWGMPRLVARVPGMRVTINLVPSLVSQVADYASGACTDRWLDLARVPAADLGEDDACFVLDNFFAANRRTMIDIHPRYRDLHRRRRFSRLSAAQALGDFSADDLRDLQVWSILAWFHPLAAEENEAVAALIRKGRGFTEDDKSAMLDAQQAILADVLPLHRRLADDGVLELTTSPYYHPILPLLVDMESAREAMPNVALPEKRRSVVEDAEAQLRRAVELHTVVFGQPPTGMWPSEGSVSEGIVPLVAAVGIEWMATDEEVLAQSLGRRIRREATGSVGADADVLYRPYRVAGDGAEVSMVFRDHCLSDLVGFQYRYGDPEAAARDFLSRLLRIGRHTDRPDCLVPVILDGENAWEHYPNQGVAFLTALYEQIARSPEVAPVRISDFLAEHPPTADLPRLAAGSWINHNFAIWVGHEEDVRAWDYVFTARAFLEERAAAEGDDAPDPADLATAREEVYVAEGSDWYWWYGDDHSSGRDEEFDRLFRTHLKNVYTALGAEPPALFDVPVISAARLTAYAPPKSFLDVVVEGRDSNYFEWLDAGHYHAASRYGAMRRASAGTVTDLYFAFNEQSFFLKLTGDGPLRSILGERPVVQVTFREPREIGLSFRWADGGRPAIEAAGEDGVPVAPAGVEAALDMTFELAVPFTLLGAAVGDPVQFAVEIGDADGLAERIPDSGTISFARPGPDFEQINWQA